jgi:AraC family transcriptional regulator
MRQSPMHPPIRSRGDARFSEDMRAAFGGARPVAAQLRELRFGSFTVMDVRCDAPEYGCSAPIPTQDARLVALQLRDNVNYDIWEDGKRLDCLPATRGTVNIYDLNRSVVSASASPFHSLTFTLPARAFDASDEAGSDLKPWPSRTALLDPVIQGLGMALLPALADPDRAPRMFIEHVLLALRAHLVQRFEGQSTSQRGGLSSRQLKRAQSFVEAHLSENISLTDVAASCSLSAAHFAREFRQSTGLPPHRFLMERRVTRARELLVHTRLPLSDIAMRCGFADQSHLTKVFRRVLGVTPGSLRSSGR